MKNNVETKIAKARRAFVRAAKRLLKLKAEYRARAERIYLVPGFPNVWEQWCGGDTAEPLTRDTQFITFAARDNVYPDRRCAVWEHAPKSDGWEFRPISECKWRVIERLELAILDAWEQFNDAEETFIDMARTTATLF